MKKHLKSLKIISGGQTGVDRAALDAAITLNLKNGGWCPRNRRAEDGRIDIKYPLTETETSFYQERTRKNVEDSDGTLILCEGQLNRGTLLTVKHAQQQHKPLLVVNPSGCTVENVLNWLTDNKIKVINIAGPRESTAPGIYAKSFNFIISVFGQKHEVTTKDKKAGENKNPSNV
ncbi:MAG: putative molybdenum carrier protein [Victivallaceae bacterium]